MDDHDSRICIECQGTMAPVIVMDKLHPGPTKHRHVGSLEYRLPDDRLSFWTGKFTTAGNVRAFMCAGCGRIGLYGEAPGADENAAQ